MRHLVQRWADDRSRKRPRSRWSMTATNSPLIQMSATPCWALLAVCSVRSMHVVTLSDHSLASARSRGQAQGIAASRAASRLPVGLVLAAA